MTIRAMSLDDLRMVLGWAANEGWNPGLEDAEAFFAADSSGFLIKDVDGQSVSAISVVKHDAEFAFLGLYLCKPEYRGQGHGIDVWAAGIAQAGGRSIGLDGVPDQQANYARSGFVRSGRSVRYEGQVDPLPDPRFRLASQADLNHLIDLDARSCGIQRTKFATAWLSPAPTRHTMVLRDGSDITGFATFRRCCTGSKVGPLQASTAADARALLSSNPFIASGEPMYVDVQDTSPSLSAVLDAEGFTPIFETARMFSGRAPETKGAQFQAIATMELS